MKSLRARATGPLRRPIASRALECLDSTAATLPGIVPGYDVPHNLPKRIAADLGNQTGRHAWAMQGQPGIRHGPTGREPGGADLDEPARV